MKNKWVSALVGGGLVFAAVAIADETPSPSTSPSPATMASASPAASARAVTSEPVAHQQETVRRLQQMRHNNLPANPAAQSGAMDPVAAKRAQIERMQNAGALSHQVHPAQAVTGRQEPVAGSASSVSPSASPTPATSASPAPK